MSIHKGQTVIAAGQLHVSETQRPSATTGDHLWERNHLKSRNSDQAGRALGDLDVGVEDAAETSPLGLDVEAEVGKAASRMVPGKRDTTSTGFSNDFGESVEIGGKRARAHPPWDLERVGEAIQIRSFDDSRNRCIRIIR